MAELKALLRSSALWRRRDDSQSTSARRGSTISTIEPPPDDAVPPPPYTEEDPRMAAQPCQSPVAQSVQPRLPPQSPHTPTTQSNGSRSSFPGLNRSQQRASTGNGAPRAGVSVPSASPPPFPNNNNNGNGNTQHRGPGSYPAIAPAPPPRPVSAPHGPGVQVHVSEATSPPSPPYTSAPGREHLSDLHAFHNVATSSTAGPSTRRASRSASRSPPRVPTPPDQRQKGHISSLPLGLLHQILSLTLDPTVTPSREQYLDPELEPCLRLAVLFKLRGVDRRFFLAATSILRDRLIPAYMQLLPPGASSNPHPLGGDGTNPTRDSVFAQRSREAAVLDRFIALRVGEDLRKAESTLYDDSGEQSSIVAYLQPAARTEDLLLTLPPTLIHPRAPPRGELLKTFPLPHPHLQVQNSPLWTSLYLSQGRVDVPQPAGWRAPRKTLVVEIRRQPSAEETVVKLREALEHIRRGWREWGERIA